MVTRGKENMIRNAETADLPVIQAIYAHARQFMFKTGNPTQWTDGYPSEALLRNDIENHNLYVVEEDGRICGVFAFIIGPDETYARIEQGMWLSEREYGTIHRVAGDGTVHGLLSRIVSYCEKTIPHLRIDTHQDNQIMQHAIRKCGFSRCGIIYVSDGSPRIAYEKAGEEVLNGFVSEDLIMGSREAG